MPSLSALLVSRKLVDINTLRQAMVRQVVVGGSLDSALLEQTSIPETQLLDLLAEATDFSPITGEILSQLSPRMADVIPREVSEELGICPACWRSGKLVILTTERVSFIAIDELSFEMGLELIPMVSTELRVVQALSVVYGLEISERFSRLLTNLGPSMKPCTTLEIDIDVDLEEVYEELDSRLEYMRHLTAEERLLVEMQIMHRQTFLD